MKKTLLLLAVSLLVPPAAIYAENTPPTSQAPPAGKRIELKTKSLELVYQADGKGRLSLEKVGSLDGAWTSPLKGPMFPSTPCHDENGPRYISPLSIVTADGSNGIDLRYESHSLEKTAPGVEHLTITLQDRVQAITVELHMRVYHDEDTIEQWLVLKNKTGKPIQVPRLSSLYFQADVKKEIHLEWYSSYTYHTAGEPFREKLNMGRRVLESRDGNRHMAGPLPAFILGFGAAPSEPAGPCMIAAFEWTGNTRFSFEINDRKELEASVEVNQSQPPVLEDGGSMASPRSISTFSPAGIGPASRNLHRWTRSHLLPDGNRLRLIDNNSWEGCSMDVSESAILKMMEDSVNLGIELYVLDDGWFGNGAEARTSPRAGLGDWQFNKDRFPQGLDNIMKASKKLGIEFGIWFEPEMVNPKSKLFQTKPEWVMRNPGHELALQRGQAALDVANPDVQEFMFASVNDLLTAYPDIRFVKWDCNSNINNPYSPYLGAGRQGNMLNAYNNGYLGVMRHLVEAHPGVDFQACGSGGGRANYAAMRYSQTFWPSDATDPRYRLRAQWNFSRFMPPLAITAHVTHAGGDAVRPKFRFDVSMMCQLGMEVDTRKSSPEYLASAKTGIAAYKQVREIVQFGDQYRHAHPTDSTTPSMNFVSHDLKRALVLAYQIGSAPNPIPFTTPVSGLDPNAVYEAVEINLPEGDATPRLAPGAERCQTGAAWMKNGIPLVFTRPCDSAAIVLDAKRIPASPAPAIFQERMEPKNTAAKSLRILCVGDSITAGFTDNPTWDVPFEFGYRQGLFERLQKAGYQVQFVGDSPEPWDGRFGVPKNSPSPDLRAIGQDRHEGHGGWNTAQVLQHIDQWIGKSQPDFVLLMIGINDAGRPPAAENLKDIVEKIVAARPQAHVVVAQITPRSEFTQSIADYNTSIRDTLVPEFQRRGCKVTTVDQYRNMLKPDGTIAPELFSNKINHPNATGYERMAQTWFDAIQAIFPLAKN